MATLKNLPAAQSPMLYLGFSAHIFWYSSSKLPLCFPPFKGPSLSFALWAYGEKILLGSKPWIVLWIGHLFLLPYGRMEITLFGHLDANEVICCERSSRSMAVSPLVMWSSNTSYMNRYWETFDTRHLLWPRSQRTVPNTKRKDNVNVCWANIYKKEFEPPNHIEKSTEK